MATGRAILQAHVDGLLPESIPLDFQWSFPDGILEIRANITLNSGDNSISIPTLSKMVITIPPTTNGTTLKWKGAGGDTGRTMALNQPDAASLGAGGTFILNAGGSAISGVKLIFLG